MSGKEYTQLQEDHPQPPAVSVQPDGVKYGYLDRPPQPPEHLGLSLFSLVCCFWPLGLIALIYSFRSRYRYYDGNYAASQKYSKSAYNFARGAIVVGILCVVGILLLYFVAGALPHIIIAATGGYNDDDNGETTDGY